MYGEVAEAFLQRYGVGRLNRSNVGPIFRNLGLSSFYREDVRGGEPGRLIPIAEIKASAIEFKQEYDVSYNIWIFNN